MLEVHMKRIFLSIWLLCATAFGAALPPGLGLSFRTVSDMTNYTVLALQTNLIASVQGEGVFNYAPGGGVVDHRDVFPASGLIGTWRRSAFSVYGGGTGVTNLLTGGYVGTAYLGSGVADGTTYLRGDASWASVVSATSSNSLTFPTVADMTNYTGTVTNVFVLGRVTVNDRGGGAFYKTTAGTANLGTCFAGVASGFWNRVIDGPTRTEWFGTPTAPTTCDAELTDAVTVAKASQLKHLVIAAGTYTNNLSTLDCSGIELIDGYGATINWGYTVPSTVNSPFLAFVGSLDLYQTLGSTASEGATNIVCHGMTNTMANGDIILINSTTGFHGSASQSGELGRVYFPTNIYSGDVVPLSTPLHDTYLTSATARAAKVTTVTTRVSGLTIDCWQPYATNAHHLKWAIQIKYGQNCVVQDCTFKQAYVGVGFWSCWNSWAYNCNGYDSDYLDNPDPGESRNCYGVAFWNASTGCGMEGGEWLNYWQVTDLGSSGTEGVPWDIVVRRVKGKNMSLNSSVFGHHSNAGSVVFDNCEALGDPGSTTTGGFDSSAKYVTIRNCRVRNLGTAIAGSAAELPGESLIVDGLDVVEPQVGSSSGVIKLQRGYNNVSLRNITMRSSASSPPFAISVMNDTVGKVCVFTNIIVDGMVLNNLKIARFDNTTDINNYWIQNTPAFRNIQASALVSPNSDNHAIYWRCTNDLVMDNVTTKNFWTTLYDYWWAPTNSSFYFHNLRVVGTYSNAFYVWQPRLLNISDSQFIDQVNAVDSVIAGSATNVVLDNVEVRGTYPTYMLHADNVGFQNVVARGLRGRDGSTLYTGTPAASLTSLLTHTNLSIGNITVSTNIMFTATALKSAALGTKADGTVVKIGTGVTADTSLSPASDPSDASATNFLVQGGIYSYNSVHTNNLVVGTGTSPGTTMVDIGPAAQGTNGVWINGGVQTNASAPALTISQTHNNAGIAYKTVRIVDTNTASASGSRPFEVYGGPAAATRLFDIDGNGGLYGAYTLDTGGDITGGGHVKSAAASAFAWNGRTRMYAPEDGGLRICNNAFTIDRARIVNSPKSTPMGATTSVVLLGLTSTNFTGGAIHYTICDTHTGAVAGGTNGVQVGSGVLMYSAGAYNIGGVTNYIVQLNDRTNAAVNVDSGLTFGWTWTALTNYIGSPQGFYLQLTPTNTVVNRATTETCTVTYDVLNNSAQLVTPQP